MDYSKNIYLFFCFFSFERKRRKEKNIVTPDKPTVEARSSCIQSNALYRAYSAMLFTMALRADSRARQLLYSLILYYRANYGLSFIIYNSLWTTGATCCTHDKPHKCATTIIITVIKIPIRRLTTGL